MNNHLHIDVRLTVDTDAEKDELIMTSRSRLRLLADKVEESDPAEWVKTQQLPVSDKS